MEAFKLNTQPLNPCYKGPRYEKTKYVKYVPIDSYIQRPFSLGCIVGKIFGYEVSEASYILAVYTDASNDPMARNVVDLVDETL